MSQRQCLPIDDNESDSDMEINFDLNQISAHKYLKSVRMERESIQEIVSVEIPQNLNTNENVQAPVAIKRQLQTKEWQDHQKELFENLQSKICEIRNMNRDDKLLSELPMNIDDENECINYCKDNEPLLSVIFTLDSYRQVENFLELLADHFTEIFEDLKSKDLEGISTEFAWLGRWTYALIACLRIPLSPEAHNSIRIIAKNCIYLVDHFQSLNDVPSDSLQLLPLNLLITIIVNNFHQHDLLSL